MLHRGWKLFRDRSSLEQLLRALYPDHPWVSSQFLRPALKVPSGYWNERENRRAFLDRIGKELGITQVMPFASERATR